MKHTPGPWETSVTSDGKWWDVCREGGGDCVAHIIEGETAEGDANLIASAPELLQALKDLQKELRAHVKFDVWKHYSLMVADVAADKAIRKAKGE